MEYVPHYFYHLFPSVDVNGNIARLESLESPPQKIESAGTNSSVSDKKRKHSDNAGLPSPIPNSISDNACTNSSGKEVLEVHKTNWDSCKQDLTNLIG